LHETQLSQKNALVAFDHLSLEFEKMSEGIRIAKEVLARLSEKPNK
jgi:hypothetical protein